jgi:uncharacterized membrane protein
MGIITTLVQLILISISPVLELRAAIPYGILVKDWPWFVVFAVCSVANFLVAPLIYLFLDKFIHLLFFIGWFERIYKKYVEKAQHRAQKYVDKYGHYGVMFFIGIPLPGSGVWTGTLVAYLIGMNKRHLMVAAFGGSLMAGAIITGIVLSGRGLFGLFF